MVNVRKLIGIMLITMSALILSACGGGGSDVESGAVLPGCNVPNILNADNVCVPPPPIQCDAPTVPNAANDACVVGFNASLPAPVFSPAQNQAVLYYNRAAVDATNSPNDSAYEGWRLHTWSNDACDAYADADTAWENGRIHDGIDPVYGAYWILDLKPGYAGTPGACHNFIIHIGTEDSGKEMGGGDFAGNLSQDDPTFARMNFTFSGVAEIYEFPIDSLGEQPVAVEGAAAHWLDPQTILWNVDDAVVDTVKLHYSATADLDITLEGVQNSTTVELTEIDLSDAQQMIAPHLNDLTAFVGDWSNDDAKAVLKTQAIVGAYDSEGKLVAATRMQLPNVIDELYTTGDADADEAVLGPIYTDSGISAAVWAPTAQNVALKLYNADKTLASTNTMTLDPVSGVWSFDGDMSLDRQLYRYEVTVYSPVNDTIEVLDVTDPYSVGLSTNGRFSMFVNLNDDDLKPEGWDDHAIPTVENFEDIVIYEGHIRNFSIRDESTSPENRGKYLAFTEQDSVPMQHLKDLVDAGLTHFHMLPANDIATINEDPSRTIEWTDTIGDFCALAPASDVCNDGTSLDASIQSVYESYEPLSDAQDLANQLRNFDTYNWGYDPKHFNTPEGSYASSAEGVERIIEMRAMNQSLHEIGLRVALDVVYNHTNASGLFTNSVFDKVVPGYYHRYTIETGDITRETCCDDTEPRNRMMEKFMEDSLKVWVEQYKFDAIRFDIMSQASKTTMVNLFETIKEIDEDIYFYGEGWGKNTAPYGDFEIASQINMAGTEIGTFNDRIREAVRQGHIFTRGETAEDITAALNAQDRVKMSLAGTLTDFILNTSGGNDAETAALGGYAEDPADIINYVSKHDNETLWDQFNYVLPSDITLEQRVRAQNIGIGIPLMSQGIPFLQMGGDFLRSKSMDRNTFDSGDWFNYVDFTMQTNNWHVGLPLAQDNEGRWEEMTAFIFSPERAASMNEIEFASEVFQELLSIRSGSPLFRLTTAQDIKERVGFHNLGTRQQVGLIAMSIDDGVTPDSDLVLDDLDPNYDAIMVVINSGYDEKSIEVLTAAGFELHQTIANSIDPVVRGASFSDTTADDVTQGTFTVPALSIAVFVKAQGTARGYGLSSTATAGAPDVVPYGDTVVYLRGGMNGWGTDNPMAYLGNGVYETAVELTADTTYGFKVAAEDWGNPNLGNGDATVEVGVDKTLQPGGGDLSIAIDTTATYVFTVDASDTDAPILSVVNEEPYVGTPVYLRGGMNGWGTADELEYQGARIYTKAVDLDVQEYGFKIADADWSTPNFGAFSDAPADANVILGQNQLLSPGGADLKVNITEAGSYVFIFDTKDLDAPVVRIFNEEFFGANTVFIRGTMNGWGEDDSLIYNDDGTYSVEIALDGSDVIFKVATGDWSTVNLGSLDDDNAAVTIGEDYILTGGANPGNMTIAAPEAGTYEFKVIGPDGNAPTLQVNPVNP